jgi:tetratricopeptide (TPR) repeat protein
VENLRAALGLYREQGDRYGESRVLAYLGDALLALGQYAVAEGHLRASLALCQERGDHSGAAEVRNILGRLLDASGHPDAAHLEFTAALDGARAAGSPLEQVRALTGLGRLALRTGRLAEGTGQLQDALELAHHLGVPEAAELGELLAGLPSRAAAGC